MTDKIIIDGVDVNDCLDIYCGTNCANTGASCPDKEFYEEITKKKPNKKTIPPLIIPYRLNKSITCKELEKVPSMDLEEIYRGKVIKWLGK